MLDVEELRQVRDLNHRILTQGSNGFVGLDGASVCAVTLLARQLREAADHLEVHGLGALDESRYTDRFGQTTAQWFAHHTGMDPAVGHAQIKTARLLRSHLQGSDQAWADGTITRRHVDAMVHAANPRVRDRIVEVELDLIDRADGRVFKDWKANVDDLVSLLDEDGPDPTDPANTRASWSRSGDFALLRAQFGGEDAEVLEQIIDKKVDELFRRQAKDREQSTDIPTLTRNHLRGHAIAELLRNGFIAAASPDTIRAGVSLVLRPAAEDPSGWARLTESLWTLTNPTGRHLVLDHFATLLCDCAVHPLLVNTKGNPLVHGMDVRFATDKLKRAAIIRDGGLCVFPGCDRTATHFHHVIWFERGGPTNIDNIAGLCPSHHGVTHRTGWSMHATPDSWFWWRTPSGDSVECLEISDTHVTRHR